MDKQITVEVIIEGQVQNVGFRSFVQANSTKFDLLGYVKNEQNGSVKIVLQGKESIINKFLSFLKNNHPGHIEQMNKTLISVATQYHNFNIRR